DRLGREVLERVVLAIDTREREIRSRSADCQGSQSDRVSRRARPDKKRRGNARRKPNPMGHVGISAGMLLLDANGPIVRLSWLAVQVASRSGRNIMGHHWPSLLLSSRTPTGSSPEVYSFQDTVALGEERARFCRTACKNCVWNSPGDDGICIEG